MLSLTLRIFLQRLYISIFITLFWHKVRAPKNQLCSGVEIYLDLVILRVNMRKKTLYNLTLTIANITEPVHIMRANTIRPCPGTLLATRRFRPLRSLLYMVVNTMSHLRTDITATSNMEDVNLKSVTLFSICFGDPPENKADLCARILFCGRIILEKWYEKFCHRGIKIYDVIMPMGFAMYHASIRRKYAQRQYPNDGAYNNYG